MYYIWNPLFLDLILKIERLVLMLVICKVVLWWNIHYMWIYLTPIRGKHTS